MVLWGVGQCDRLFRTRGNAQAAGVAGISVRRKGLLPAMRQPLQFAAQTHLPAQRGCDGSDREDIEGTDRHALRFALAAIAVDYRSDDPGRLFAVRLLCLRHCHCQIITSNLRQTTG